MTPTYEGHRVWTSLNFDSLNKPLGSGSIQKTYMVLFSPIRAFIACTWVLPHTPTDGAARIFSLTNMPKWGIELVSAQL